MGDMVTSWSESSFTSSWQRSSLNASTSMKESTVDFQSSNPETQLTPKKWQNCLQRELLLLPSHMHLTLLAHIRICHFLIICICHFLVICICHDEDLLMETLVLWLMPPRADH